MNKPTIDIHRFNQCAGLAILNNDGTTVYLTSKECRNVAAGLFKIARSIEREKFTASPCLTTNTACHNHPPKD